MTVGGRWSGSEGTPNHQLQLTLSAKPGEQLSQLVLQRASVSSTD